MMEPINIAGLDRMRARTEKYFGRARKRPDTQVAFTNADGTPNEQPALQGVACVYGKKFQYEGRTVVFEYGCFGNVYDPGVERKLLFDHNDGDVIGTTADGLEFANSPDGLVYRLPLTDNARAADVKAKVASNEKACASVGCRIVETTRAEVEGEMVDIITKADLFETSICFWGKVPGTSASIVDLSRVDADIRAASRTLDFAVDQLASNIATNAKHAAHNIALLNEKIADYEAAPPRATSATPDTIARWQTASTEAMQMHGRQASARR
jgi:HK97 family phage prohead protease